MRDRPVIVTGAAGLIGRTLARKLYADGTPTIGVLRTVTESVPFETATFDLQHQSLLELRGLNPVAVVHCAASVPAPPDNPDDAAAGRATRNIDDGVIEACFALGCRLIYVSSCILYDQFSSDIKDEDAVARVTTPYADAKRDGELRASTLAGTVVMRVPSPVGERMRRSTVLPRFVADALNGRPLEVWGSGEREQDFIDVADIAEFVSLVLRSDVEGTFNVASGRPVTMRRLADQVVAVIGAGSVVVSDRPDPFEGATARYDTSLARDRVGWTARVGLETMIRRVAASYALT